MAELLNLDLHMEFDVGTILRVILLYSFQDTGYLLGLNIGIHSSPLNDLGRSGFNMRSDGTTRQFAALAHSFSCAIRWQVSLCTCLNSSVTEMRSLEGVWWGSYSLGVTQPAPGRDIRAGT